jgi:hypothetical protein
MENIYESKPSKRLLVLLQGCTAPLALGRQYLGLMLAVMAREDLTGARGANGESFATTRKSLVTAGFFVAYLMLKKNGGSRDGFTTRDEQAGLAPAFRI